jgi:hypothetical protein
MTKNNLQLVVALVLIALLLALVNPFHVWAMPSMFLVGFLSIIAVLFCVFVGFILSESASDEREESQRNLSGRAGFLSGASILTLALLYQGLTHMVDPWIPGALAFMIAAKVSARLYAERYR